MLNAELTDLIPLGIAQVGAFASAAQRGDRMHAAFDQAVDGAAERVEVNAFAIGAERGDGVADDAVNVWVRHGVSPSKKVGSVQAIGVLAQVLPSVIVESSGVALGPGDPVVSFAAEFGNDRLDGAGAHR